MEVTNVSRESAGSLIFKSVSGNDILWVHSECPVCIVWKATGS